MRLVLEGGFMPDEITPHPPLACLVRRSEKQLVFDPASETTTELTVLGGLKTKNIDVVVTKDQVGPVLAISVKGTTKSFRNLTNRMEEAIGDSTNLHIIYPGLVYGFFHVLRVNREGEPGVEPNDVSVDAEGGPVNSVRRYHEVLLGLTGRRLVRDDFTRYESVGFALVETQPGVAGSAFAGFPPTDSPLAPEKFFTTLYRTYDLRFPFVGSSMSELKREVWATGSPIFRDTLSDETGLASALGYAPRVG